MTTKQAPAEDDDPYYRKTLAIRLHGRTLELDVAHDLFSGHDLDAGTRLLLRTLVTPEHERRSHVVDLGCGYGPLGLGLKLLVPTRSVDMVDRDALAVVYSRRNAERNRMTNVHVYTSLGWNDIPRAAYDLAVSNIPAKAGERAIRHFLLDARQHLRPGGLVAVVVIARLDGVVQDALAQSGDVRISFSRRTTGYSVYHFGFSPEVPPQEAVAGPLAVFERDRVEARFGGVEYELRTAYSLPDFDTLGYDTELIGDRLLELRRPPRHLLVFNPGQGHLPVLAWKHLQPDRVTLAGRDLLALRYSEANAAGNGCPPDRLETLHRVAVQPSDLESADLALVVLKDGQPAAVSEYEVRSLVRVLGHPGRLLVAGTSTAITRLESAFARQRGVRLVGRRRERGHSMLELAV